MDYIEYRSMSEELYVPTDCRVILVTANYVTNTHASAIQAAQKLCRFIINLQDGQFVSRWHYKNRETSDNGIGGLMNVFDDSFSFWNESNVKSQYIYNVKTFHEYSKTLRYDYNVIQLYGLPSIDYPEFISELLSIPPQSSEEWKEKVLSLLRESPRVNQNYYNNYDMTCLFDCHRVSTNELRGQFTIQMAVGTANGQEQKVAEAFASFLQEESLILNDVSGQVGISPWPCGFGITPYMKYFGNFPDTATKEEQRRSVYEYLCGVEWGNLVSFSIRPKLAAQEKKISTTQGVKQINLENGSTFIQLETPINQVGVQELALKKQLLYPALFPGESEFVIATTFSPEATRFSLRRLWENIPVSEEEISISFEKIVFHHAQNNGTLE